MSRKIFRLLLTAAGVGAFVLLLARFGLSSILAIVARVGWAFPFLLLLQIFAEVANAAGWRLCFSPDVGPPPPFATLVRLRLAGDGINYVVPTATIGGELVRIELLDPNHARADRTSSVVVARLAQDLALASLAAAGFWMVANHALGAPSARPAISLWWAPVAAAVACGILAAAWHWLGRQDAATRAGQLRLSIGKSIRSAANQMRAHPARFAAAITVFGFGYLWGSVEAYWICRLIGRPVGAGTAAEIEILSLTIDAIVFLVPAKIGTQEAGKTLVFSLLGLTPRDGFAFGLIRHVRELFWAGLGLLASAPRRSS